MPLRTYRQKRNFRKTPEPAGTRPKPGKRPIFVVQEHHASRLHYDLRLEADGVLKSWAVPKGASMDPADKRLAIQVEDHPLAYAKFSGDIPQGEYGAGHVDIWDQGTYDNLMADKPDPLTLPQSIDAGHVEFALHGKRLKGAFALIRTRPRGNKPSWLLIKMKDDHALSAAAAEPKATMKPTSKSKKSRPAKGKVRPGTGRREPVAFTRVDKVMFPDAGLTKGDLIHYYLDVADRLLPYLKDRPITLERLPDGIGGPRFWQKNTPAYYPKWIPRVRIPTRTGKPVDYVMVNDAEALAYLVNQGTLTFHINLSRVSDLDRPDLVLFDLDPPQGRFADAVKIAREIHALLNPMDLEAYVKTSGKRGLHVMVPWKRPGGYTEARAFALDIAERVVGRLDDIATLERAIARRRGKVYVDIVQNAMGHHAVAPWTVRAAPTATISTPLQWKELTARLDPQRFTLQTLGNRLARRKTDYNARLLAKTP